MKRQNMILLLFVSFIAFIIAPLFISYYTFSREFLHYTEDEISRFSMINLNNSEEINGIVFNEIYREIIRIPMNESVSYIGKIKSYDAIQKTVSHILQYNRAHGFLLDTAYSSAYFHSIYLYSEGADYVITTDNGIVKYEDFTDLGWLERRDGGAPGLPSNRWVPRKIPGSGLAQYPDKSSEVNVISCVYPIQSVIAGFDGFIVANVYEKDFCDLANNSEFDAEGFCYVIDTAGTVVLHPDKSLFADSLADDGLVSQILASGQPSGSITGEDGADGSLRLIVYQKTDFSDWIYIGSHSLDSLTGQVTALRNRNLLLLSVIISLGLIVISVLLVKIASPVGKLLASLRSRGTYGGGARNEFEYLLKAFEEITGQEKQLREVVESNRNRVQEMYVLDLLHGLPARHDPEDGDIVAYRHECFQVCVFSVDKNADFVGRFTSEQRSYFLNFIAARCEAALYPEGFCTSAVIEGGSVAVIVNCGGDNLHAVMDSLRTNAETIAAEASSLVNHTLTTGIGAPCRSTDDVPRSFQQALEATDRKIVAGYGRVIVWDASLKEHSGYYYPYQRETRILNYLNTGNESAVVQELDALSEEMSAYAADNIVQVMHVLLGVIIKYCAEKDIRISSAFGNTADLYALLADRETLPEKKDLLAELCVKVIQYASREVRGEQSHIDQITEYINNHYKEEMDFEKMAAEIGISYSYIRKIVKEKTGASLLDLVNIRRINEAKRLLRETGMTLASMSSQLGYSNLQSFNRFFKKYEGITPGEYRYLNTPEDQRG